MLAMVNTVLRRLRQQFFRTSGRYRTYFRITRGVNAQVSARYRTGRHCLLPSVTKCRSKVQTDSLRRRLKVAVTASVNVIR